MEQEQDEPIIDKMAGDGDGTDSKGSGAVKDDSFQIPIAPIGIIKKPTRKPEPELQEPSSTSSTDNEPEASTSSPSDEVSFTKSEEYAKNILAAKHEKYSAMLAQLKYETPPHAKPFDTRYALEILKGGQVVDNVKFSSEKSFYVIGRIPACDLVAEHPTLSRFHAVFQYLGDKMESGEEDERGYEGTGLYIYDLNSTHGTFLNKHQLFPRRYYRLKVGHVVKFGNSTRLYIVNGPPEDEEKESDKTVTEILKEKVDKEIAIKRMREQGIKEVEYDRGIDWGMSEDAIEEEVNLNINPFAKDFESTELNLENPKKTLRGWFEREGYDLVYDLKEKSSGHFVCRINLPLDGPGGTAVFAEIDSKGKKKDIVLECALQACQILDKYGVLRQAHHEGFKRKLKDWEEQDYYSSDEDAFLDRTGELERKRKMRMKQAGKLKETTETYESLTKKYDEVSVEIEKLRLQIKDAENQKKAEDEDIDPLDAFMQDLKKGGPDIKKLKSKLKELTEEQNRILKLIKVVKPNAIPELRDSGTKVPDDKKVAKPQLSSSFPKLNPQSGSKKLGVPIAKAEKLSVEETSTPKINLIEDLQNESDKVGTNRSSNSMEVEAENDVNLADKIPHSEECKDEPDDLDANTKADTLPPPAKKKRHRPPHSKKETTFEYDASNPDYSVWVPPENQSGDGKISLNEKLGY